VSLCCLLSLVWPEVITSDFVAVIYCLLEVCGWDQFLCCVVTNIAQSLCVCVCACVY
jgi:hypothetical protein